MARTVEDIIVRLGITGFENLDRLRGSFRELGKATGATDDQLDHVRSRLLELRDVLGDTTRVNRGLTDAFTGLLDEAQRGSAVWQQLQRDLSTLRQESRLTDTHLATLRDVVLNEATAHAQSANSTRAHIRALQDLRNQASLNGQLHRQLGADIQTLTVTLNEGTVANRRHNSALGQILAVRPDAVLTQWRAYTRILQEGTVSAEQLATAERRLRQLSGAPRILERRRIAESAAVTQDPEYLRRFGFEGRSLPELPNTPAGYSQQIQELQQDLANLDRSSLAYLQTLMQLAGVQRQATEVARGYAQALFMGVQTSTVTPSLRNLQEVITALRAEMQQLDTTTAEGNAIYAANANQIRNLENRLRDLAGAYRHVGDMATQAATAEQNAANARTRDNYLNRSRVIQQEQAYTRLAARILAETYRAPLMLPAAGQTSAPGTGQTVSGGPNVRPGRRRSLADVFGADVPTYGLPPGLGVQRFFGQGDVGLAAGTPTYGPAASPQQAERARSAYIANAAAARANAEATQVLERRLESLRAEVTKADAANTGSITSLNRVRDAIHALRNELVPTSKEFEQYTQRLQRVDRQAARASAGPRRLSGMQMAQGVGAALSGGIFGGPEGLIGGLGGLAFGGVGGAFAGAAAGAQVGMFRQQLAGFADYAASLDKMKIALRGIVKDQASYNTVLAAANAATRELNVPQEAAIGGLTRLSAAILGAGGTVNQSTFAFRALTEAVTATGGKAEQVDGAMLALTQVFSKGKVSAEELNQIAERLPGTYTLFAEATGRTGPQLAKGLEQGKIGLNDLMKFLELLRTKHGQTALEIAASSENAGERLKVAYDKMREDVGRALQPLGAQFQSVFAKALKDATPALINLAQGLAKVIQVLGANAGAIALVAKFGVVLTSTIYAGRAFAALGPLVSGAAALMGAAFGRTTAQAIMAERQLKLFAATARTTAASLAIPIVLSVAIIGADVVIQSLRNIKQNKEAIENLKRSQSPQDWLKAAGGAALTKAQLSRIATEVIQPEYSAAQTTMAELQKTVEDDVRRAGGRAGAREEFIARIRKAAGSQPALDGYSPAFVDFATKYVATEKRIAILEGRMQLLVGRIPTAPTQTRTPGFAEPPGVAAGAAGAGADAAKQQRDLFQQANEYVNANIELLKARGQLSEEQAATEFDRANLAKKFAIDELTLRKQALDLQKKYNQITPDIYTKSLQTLDVERQKIETAYNKTVAQIGEDISKINEEIFAGLGAPFDQRNVNEFERALDDLYQRVDKGVVDAEKKGGPSAAAFLKRARELTTADYQRAASRSTVETLTKQITELQRGKGEVTTLDTIIADYGDSWQKLEEPVRKHLEQLATTVDHLKEIQRYKQDPNTYAGLREGAQGYLESIGTLRSNIADLAQTGFKGVEDSITSLMTTGTANFREFATSLIADMTRVIVRQFIMRSLMQALGFLAPTPASAATGSASSLSQFNAGAAQYGTGLGFAKGGAFDAANRIVPFAYGGVVNKPTMFKFADGGLMRNGVAGEAGPEAIMPLRRLPSGRLGVESSGGGAAPITIQVNVDASGNQQLSGDAGQGQALGRVIAAVVQQELVNQKRPGGLLAS